MLKMLSVLLAALLLGGCASTGYKIADTQSALVPQEPWQAVVLWNVDIRKERSFAVVRIPLPNPLSAVWRWDMNDHHRTYLVGKDERVLRRSVWRAVVFDGMNPVRMYNAVPNPSRTAMFVLVPGGAEKANGLLRQNLTLISGDACFVQTTKRDIVPLPEHGKLPDGFFGSHPSPVTADMIHIMDESTETGRRFLEDLWSRFPKLVSGQHSARSDVVDVAQLTAEVGVSDRAISKGSLPIGASMFAGGPFNPITAISMVVRNREVFAGGVCKDVHEQLGVKPETVSWQSNE